MFVHWLQCENLEQPKTVTAGQGGRMLENTLPGILYAKLQDICVLSRQLLSCLNKF
jgi:hypothetical protein